MWLYPLLGCMADAMKTIPLLVAALLVAAVKEEMALLAAGLGVWAMWRELRLEIGDWRLRARNDDKLKIKNLQEILIS